jgi:hypothetical protein
MSPTNNQMSKARSTISSIFDVNVDDAEITVCLASIGNDDDLPNMEKLQLTDELTGEFRAVVRQMNEKWEHEYENNDLELRPYNAGSKPELYEIEFVDLTEQEPLEKQINVLSAIASFPLFSGDKDFLSGLRFYVIIIQSDRGEPVYYFRLYTQKRELQHSPFFGAVFERGHFDTVRTPLFLFDQHIDCFARGDLLFICKQDKFQKIFRFLEMVINKARSTLKVIKAHVPIANFAEFQTACESHALKLAKINNIASKPYLKSIKMSDIKKVIKQFDLPIKTTGTGKNEKLLFDPTDKWAILRLLDDDYLDSVMTGQNYEVTGKRPLN